jgi:hypothetical protein
VGDNVFPQIKQQESVDFHGMTVCSEIQQLLSAASSVAMESTLFVY